MIDQETIAEWACDKHGFERTDDNTLAKGDDLIPDYQESSPDKLLQEIVYIGQLRMMEVAELGRWADG